MDDRTLEVLSIEKDEALYHRDMKPLPHSYDQAPSTSSREYERGDILPVSKTSNKISLNPSDDNSFNQLQEQCTYSVDQSLADLQRIRRNNEEEFIQIKKNIREKIDNMMKIVKHSFGQMHIEGTKQIELKCEEIAKVLTRVEKLLEEGSEDFAAGTDSQRDPNAETFIADTLKEKSQIEAAVETAISNLNIKREKDEPIFMDFKEEVQTQIQEGISNIERCLETQAEKQMKAVDEKISDLRKALYNLQHLLKFS